MRLGDTCLKNFLCERPARCVWAVYEGTSLGCCRSDLLIFTDAEEKGYSGDGNDPKELRDNGRQNVLN